jgi:UTP:GlnB (protein PII) uridylyltransferase
MDHFVATMPEAYQRLYRVTEIAEHAAIVSRRGAQLVHAEHWRSAETPLLCVVAEDRPGLLALVTDALLGQGLAIQSARAFCREVGKEAIEAVDFLELRALGGPDTAAELDGDQLHAFAESLAELVARDVALHAEQRSSLKSGPTAVPTPPTRVYFERRSLEEQRYLLVVDAPDSDGLLHAVSSALHSQGMRIMACEIRTVAGRARDRFEVEPSTQRAINDAALCDVQLAVLNALLSLR